MDAPKETTSHFLDRHSGLFHGLALTQYVVGKKDRADAISELVRRASNEEARANYLEQRLHALEHQLDAAKQWPATVTSKLDVPSDPDAAQAFWDSAFSILDSPDTPSGKLWQPSTLASLVASPERRLDIDASPLKELLEAACDMLNELQGIALSAQHQASSARKEAAKQTHIADTRLLALGTLRQGLALAARAFNTPQQATNAVDQQRAKAAFCDWLEENDFRASSDTASVRYRAECSASTLAEIRQEIAECLLQANGASEALSLLREKEALYRSIARDTY